MNPENAPRTPVDARTPRPRSEPPRYPFTPVYGVPGPVRVRIRRHGGAWFAECPRCPIGFAADSDTNPHLADLANLADLAGAHVLVWHRHGQPGTP